MKRFVALCLMAVALATAPAFGDFQAGVDAYFDKDYKTALQEFIPSAEQGNSLAQFILGVMYYAGEGVPQDYKTAIKWYTLSAEQGNINAQYNLAQMYRKGEGVPQDYKQAVKWYRLSAEQGEEKAQNNLAVMYVNGNGVLQDYLLAHMWYNIAASNGGELSTENRDAIAKNMTPADISKAQDLARACVAKDYKGC